MTKPKEPESNTEKIIRAIHDSGSDFDGTMEEMIKLIRSIDHTLDMIYIQIAEINRRDAEQPTNQGEDT